MVCTILKRSWIFSSHVERSLDSVTLLGLEKSLKFNTLSVPNTVFCKIRFFAEEKLPHHRCQNLQNSPVTQEHFCAWAIYILLFLFLDFILRCYFCTSGALASHFPKCCCGKYEKTLSTMAKKVKIVNDSWLAMPEVFKRGKGCRFI